MGKGRINVINKMKIWPLIRNIFSRSPILALYSLQHILSSLSNQMTMATVADIFRRLASKFDKFLKNLSFSNLGGVIRDNILFFLWIVLVPFLLLGVRQGGELFAGLFDDAGFAVGVRASAMVLIYYAQALAIWLAPRPVFPNHPWADFQPMRALTGQNRYVGLFVSTLPITLYGLVMVVVQSGRSFVGWQFVLTLVTVAATLYAAYQVARPHDRLSRTPTLFWLQIFIVVDAALLFLLMMIVKTALFWNYYFVGLCLCLLVVLIAGVFHRLDEQCQAGNFKHYDRFYWALLSVTVAGLLLLSLVNNIQLVSPTFMLLTITTAYIVISRLIIALFILKKNQSFQFLLTVLLMGLGWMVFIHKSRIHDINYVTTNGLSARNRPTLPTFFKSWYEANLAELDVPGDTSEIPIYLVAAQGGGSRAGLWTSSLLNELEVRSDYRFHRHLFAVTSASGGSAGFGATLALWRYAEDSLPLPKYEIQRDSLYRHFAVHMFQRNYLTAQFLQLSINEIGKRALRLCTSRQIGDRNLEHQRYEALGFATAVRHGLDSTSDEDDSVARRLATVGEKGNSAQLNIGSNHPAIPNYPFLPYLSYWPANPDPVKGQLPLYFPITTNIQTGKAGYASALQWDPALFIDAIDIIAEAEKGHDGQTLALVTASNLSQLFPVMNSSTYIDNCGNFFDGGLFENMGLPLLTNLYDRLPAEIEQATYLSANMKNRLRPRLLFLVNAAIEPRDSATAFRRKNQMAATFSALTSSGISGRTTWWLEYCHRTYPENGQPDPFILQLPMDDNSTKLPLGRWLSTASINTVRSKLNDKAIGLRLDALAKSAK